MPRYLDIQMNSFPISGTFTISRGSKTTADVVTCTVSDGRNSGHGECVPYGRYGESIESVAVEIEAAREKIERGMTRADMMTAMKPGAARNAVDCALWDLESKTSGTSVASRLGIGKPKPLTTAYTISLGQPEA